MTSRRMTLEPILLGDARGSTVDLSKLAAASEWTVFTTYRGYW